jgi:hypothetical protein
MATNFFGKRVQLEESIKLLHRAVDRLKRKEVRVRERAAFLNYLMLTPRAARALYTASGLDPDAFDLRGDVSDGALPAHTPTALTRKGEYVKFVTEAYDALRRACLDYLSGNRSDFEKNGETAADDADYSLLKSMCSVINEEIDRINERCLPSQVLQTVKSFDPSAQTKEHFTGGGTYYGDQCTLNENLSFRHIEFSSLNIKEIPEPPPLEEVRAGITREAKANYAENKARIHDMIDHVKELCRRSRER